MNLTALPHLTGILKLLARGKGHSGPSFSRQLRSSLPCLLGRWEVAFCCVGTLDPQRQSCPSWVSSGFSRFTHHIATDGQSTLGSEQGSQQAH